VKTYRWLTLVAALLITLCEVLVFNSQAARGAQKQVNVAAATDLGSGTDPHLSLPGITTGRRPQMHEVQSESVDIPATAGQTLR